MRLVLNAVFLFLLFAVQSIAAVSTQTEPLQRYGLGNLAEFGSPSFSECGEFVFSAGGLGVALMDADSNEIPRMFPIYGGAGMCDVSSDGKRFLLGTLYLNVNNRIREAMIYNTKTAKWEVTFRGMDVDTISGAQFSPDDQLVITLGKYHDADWLYYSRMKVWDAQTGTMQREIILEENRCLAIGSVGSLAAACGDGTISIWNYATGELVKTISIPGAIAGITTAAFFDQDRKLIVGTSYQHQTFLVNVETGLVISTIENTYGDFALSPDESKILVAASTGSQLIRMSDLVPIRSYAGLSVRSPQAFSPDGSKAVMVGPDLSVVVADIETGEQVSSHERFNGDISQLALSPDGKKIALARRTGLLNGIDYSLQILDTATGAIATSIPLGCQAYAAQFSPDNSRLLVGAPLKTTLWDATTGQLLLTLNKTSTNVCFTPDGANALAASGGTGSCINLWNLQTDTVQTFAPDRGRHLAVSPDGTKLLVGDSSDLSLYDLNTLQHVRDYDIPPENSGIMGIAFSPDGTKVAAASYLLLRMWNVDGTVIRDFNIRQCSYIDAVSFSPDGTELAAGLHNMVWVYNLESGAIMRKFQAHNGMVSSVAFSPDSKRVYSSAWDGQAFQWSNEWQETRVCDKIMIVAGGTTDSAPEDAQRIRALADWAYLTASVRGYTSSNIRYLSAFDTPSTNPNVTAAASASAVQNAITTWGADSSRLLILMIGKGQRENDVSYFLTGGTQTSPDRLSSAQMATSLNAAQSATFPLPEAIVVIDSSYSGGFLSSMAPVPGGTQRLVIASCGDNQTAILGAKHGQPGVPSFTSSFLNWVFKGRTFANAFIKAKQSMQQLSRKSEEPQTPLLDDNGDGVCTETDGNYAELIIFGSLPESGFQDVIISDFSATTAVAKGASAKLEVEVIVPENVDLTRVEAFLTKDGGKTVVPVVFEEQLPAPSQAIRSAGGANTTSFQTEIPSEVIAVSGEYQVVFNAVRDDGLGCDLLSDPAHGVLTVDGPAQAKAWLEYR